MEKDIIVINPRSNIALCTLWSKKEKILECLGESTKLINIAGTLYTAYGVNYVFQTLGEHPEIDTLVIYGSDRSTSGKALIEAFKNSNSLLIGKEHAQIIAESVKLIDLRESYEKRDIKALKKILENNFSPKEKPKRKKLWIEVRESGVSSFPVPLSGFLICDSSPFRAWVKILKQILTFGFEKPSEYKEPQLELLNVCISIPLYGKKYELEEEFFKWIKKEDFERHVKDLLSPEKPEDVEYTYGYRLFSHGIAGNQIERIINYLAKKPYSRRCISVVIDPRSDFSSKFPPCIGVVQGVISGDYYTHSVYLRSNDMFRGWPVNIYGQIKLAEFIVNKINELAGTEYKLGSVNTISFSAHIYRHDWRFAKEVIEKYAEKLHEFFADPRGNFLLIQKENKLVIEHRTPSHELVSRKEFSSLEQAYFWLKEINLLHEHALYLGKEIGRAFEKIKRHEKYEQDKA